LDALEKSGQADNTVISDLILKMNDKLNALIEAEIGEEKPLLRLPRPRDLLERVTDQFENWRQSVLAMRDKR
jgi:hypothetical protein